MGPDFDISSTIQKWNRLTNCDEKSLPGVNDKICEEATLILSNNSNPTTSKKLVTALKEFKFNNDQKIRIYSAIAKTPVNSSQAQKLDELDFDYEDFSDTYTIKLVDGDIEVKKAILRTLGGFFETLLQMEMQETKSKIIQIPDLTTEEFNILVKPDEYDFNDPDTWIIAKTLADQYQVPSLIQAIPSFPKFTNLDEAVAWLEKNEIKLNEYNLNDPKIWIIAKPLERDLELTVPSFPTFDNPDAAIDWVSESKYTILDLAQFGHAVTNEHLDRIQNLSETNNNSNDVPPLSHLQTLVLRSYQISTLCSPEGKSKLPAGLTTLDVVGCYNLTDASIKNLPNSLTTLDVSGCHLTNASIKNLPKSLTTLLIKGNFNLTDAAIKDLPRGITTLNISGCDNLTNACIKDLPNGLITLYMSWCRKLSENAIKDLPKGLIELHLGGDWWLSSEFIKDLPRSLTTLNIYECFDLRLGANLKDLPNSLTTLYAITPQFSGATQELAKLFRRQPPLRLLKLLDNMK